MRRILTLLVTVTTIMTLTAGAASAGQGDKGRPEKAERQKVDVCHHDADAGEFHLININARALVHHLDHGDVDPEPADSVLDEECQPIAATPSIAMLVEGAYSYRGLDTSFAAFESTDGLISGVGSYYYTANRVSVTIDVEKVCLNPTDRHATVWGPGTATRDGLTLWTKFVVLTIADRGLETATLLSSSTSRDTALETYDIWCKTPPKGLEGLGGFLTFW